MRGFDRRLLKYARSTRTFLVASVFVQAVQALLIVAQAFLLASVIVRAFTGPRTWPLSCPPSCSSVPLSRPRADRFPRRMARPPDRSNGDERIADGGLAAHDEPRARVAGRETHRELAQLLVRGVGGLEAYYARYLPQLVLAVVVPLIVGVAILTEDVLAAVIVAFTVPLIPVFDPGRVGQSGSRRSPVAVARGAGNHFLDVVEGLPTQGLQPRAASGGPDPAGRR